MCGCDWRVCACALPRAVSHTSCFRQRRSWQRRFALLADGSLLLYGAPGDLQPVAQHALYASACIFPQHPKVKRSNCLQVETPSASVFLCADSPAEIKSWAIAIQRAAVVASGGTIGRLAAATTAAAAAPAPTAASSDETRRRTLSGSGASIDTPRRLSGTGASSLTLQLPLSAAGTAAAAAAQASSPLYSQAASSTLVAPATAGAYERVLQRFRSAGASSVTAFSSNASPACTAPGGAALRYRHRARRRVAEEWQREARLHREENERRRTAPPPQPQPPQHSMATPPRGSASASANGASSNLAPPPALLVPPAPFAYDVPSLGTLRLSSLTVILGETPTTANAAAAAAVPPGTSTLANGVATGSATAAAAGPSDTVVEAELSVANTADYPVAIRVGDAATAMWLRTNTPRFLEPGASCIVTFARVRADAARAGVGSNAAATAAASAAASPKLAVPASPASTSGSTQPIPTPASPPRSRAGSFTASAAAPTGATVPPALPTAVWLVLKPADASELELGAPLSLFELEDGTPAHRVGERTQLVISEKQPRGTDVTVAAGASPLPAVRKSKGWKDA